MKPAIAVENLGKKYILRHQTAERYATLRDAIASRMADLNPFRSRVAASATREEFWALKDVSFQVPQGERVGIIGRNGAGKSTLLKILSRVVEPSTGRALIRGRVASLLEVGTGFHPELTGRENVFLNGAILGMSRWEIRKKFDEIVAFAEVEKFLDTPVKRYSSGMYVRLAFAVAAHLEPEILIVDEVLAVGDAQFQAKCLGKMKTAGSEGRTVLFVSHNIHALRMLCRKGLLLDQGAMLDEGEINDVIDTYYQRYNHGSTCAVFGEDDSDIAVTRFEILDSPGAEAGRCRMGDDIAFNVHLAKRRGKQPVAVAINVSAMDGVNLLNIHSNDAGYRFSDRGEESISVVARNVQLYPGDYNVSLVVKVSDNEYIFKNDCLTFSVVQNYGRVTRQLVRAHGLVFVDSEWTVGS